MASSVGKRVRRTARAAGLCLFTAKTHATRALCALSERRFRVARDKTIERLRLLADQDNDPGDRRHKAILAALDAGHSYAEIGRALGVTRQAVYEFVARRERRD